MVSDSFIGVAMLLVGSVVFMKLDGTRRISKYVAGSLLIFIALTLVYACLSPKIGIRPY
ncbi:protein of unknown function [Paraburkholderia kururiensis]